MFTSWLMTRLIHTSASSSRRPRRTLRAPLERQRFLDHALRDGRRPRRLRLDVVAQARRRRRRGSRPPGSGPGSRSPPRRRGTACARSWCGPRAATAGRSTAPATRAAEARWPRAGPTSAASAASVAEFRQVHAVIEPGRRRGSRARRSRCDRWRSTRGYRRPPRRGSVQKPASIDRAAGTARRRAARRGPWSCRWAVRPHP